ncbi:MAG: MMPL family transporter [Alphaproteobacteria bacterium]|nr:MMPL family transporter [Alphaproteobacteria bacterium]
MNATMPSIERLVAFCCRQRVAVVLVMLLATVAALVFTATHFRMDTNSEKLVSQNTDWRQRERHFDQLFPQRNNLILVVIDGATPERADYGASMLSAALASHRDLLPVVHRPDGGDFFRKNGLLFLSKPEVASTVSGLIGAQPFLGGLAADPSLRGLMTSLGLIADGVASGQTSLSRVAHPLAALSRTLGDALAGRKTFLAWRSLVTGAPPRPEEIRRFIEVQPRLDYAALEPGEAASRLIRGEAHRLGLDPANGVRVRLTGPVPLSDEEFATLAKRADLMGVAMFAAVLLTLWLGVRSVRIIGAILLTLASGLILTTAAGLVYAHVFNIISIAFIALFVGLGVDFAIQFSVRYRAERHASGDLPTALALAGRHAGTPLALAAAATAVGFFSFLPTNYSGVAELGVVAGIGMIIAFVLSITLLPALLMLLGAPGEPEQVGFRVFRPADRFMHRHRGIVLLAALALAVVSAALLPWLKFDFNPLDLRSRKVESVSTLYDLMRNAETSPNTIDVLAPGPDAAASMARRLGRLPEAGDIVTLESFVPQDQAAKLATIADAKSLLDTTLDPFGVSPPPTGSEVSAAMNGAAGKLRLAAANDHSPARGTALWLADILARLAGAPDSARALAQAALIPDLKAMLGEIRDALSAQPVSMNSIPADLRRDWVAPDGTQRIEVHPRSTEFSNAALKSFSDAVRSVAPGATGTPISIENYGKTILRAFIQAGLISALVIAALLLVTLRHARDVIFTLVPLFLTGLLTLGSCVVLHLHLNFANVIALPLLLGIGVAFDIYFIMAWRNGATHLLASSLTRAVIFSALTTASGFGALWLSSHPGTASMGELLMISLGWTLLTTLFFLPALLEPNEA